MNRDELLLKWQEPVKVLDKGFVRIVDVLGDDAAICQMARTSYGAGTKSVSDDTALLRYLIRNAHTSPLEGCVLKFHVKMPMDVVRQIQRHRTMSIIEPSQLEFDMPSVNEVSSRYSVMPEDMAETAPDAWRLQAKDNKQGSSGFLTEWPNNFSIAIERSYSSPGDYLSVEELDLQQHAREVYEERLQFGIAREQARKDLPLSQYTEFYAVFNAWNLFHFLRLRLDSHAQLEIRLYAQVLARFCEDWLPVAWRAFQDYAIEAKTFSKSEMDILLGLISGKYDKDWSVLETQAKDFGLSKREFNEFRAKIGDSVFSS